MNRYRDIDTHAPDYEPLPFYSSDADGDGDLDLAAWLADTSATTLDDDVAAFAVVGVPTAEGQLGDRIGEGDVVESVVENIASLPADTALSVVAETGDDGGDDTSASDDIGDAAAT
jgi:hypothetical protein